MRPLDRLKADMLDMQRRRGMREKVVVDSRSLRELLDDYERMESVERLAHNQHNYEMANHLLHDAIAASYHQSGRDSERTLLVIMDTLKQLIEESRKAREIDAVFSR